VTIDISPEIILVITGSRRLRIPIQVTDILSTYVGKRVVLYHGACPTGVDKFANDFARAIGWIVRDYPADWIKFGPKIAGPKRNRRMTLDAASEARWACCECVCLAFPGPDSTGTYDCIGKAKKAGIKDIQTFLVSD
jgi:hypothetical protein